MNQGPPMDAWMVFERVGVIPGILLYLVVRLERRLAKLDVQSEQILRAIRDLARAVHIDRT